MATISGNSTSPDISAIGVSPGIHGTSVNPALNASLTSPMIRGSSAEPQIVFIGSSGHEIDYTATIKGKLGPEKWRQLVLKWHETGLMKPGSLIDLEHLMDVTDPNNRKVLNLTGDQKRAFDEFRDLLCEGIANKSFHFPRFGHHGALGKPNPLAPSHSKFLQEHVECGDKGLESAVSEQGLSDAQKKQKAMRYYLLHSFARRLGEAAETLGDNTPHDTSGESQKRSLKHLEDTAKAFTPNSNRKSLLVAAEFTALHGLDSTEKDKASLQKGVKDLHKSFARMVDEQVKNAPIEDRDYGAGGKLKEALSRGYLKSSAKVLETVQHEIDAYKKVVPVLAGTHDRQEAQHANEALDIGELHSFGSALFFAHLPAVIETAAKGLEGASADEIEQKRQEAKDTVDAFIDSHFSYYDETGTQAELKARAKEIAHGLIEAAQQTYTAGNGSYSPSFKQAFDQAEKAAFSAAASTASDNNNATTSTDVDPTTSTTVAPTTPTSTTNVASSAQEDEIKKLAASGTVNFYKNSYNPKTAFLGNFHPCDVSGFPCSEALYQAAKFLRPAESINSPHNQWILRQFSTGFAKATENIAVPAKDAADPVGYKAWQLGQNIRAPRRSDNMVPIMENILRLKYAQNPALQTLLVATGDAHLNERTDLDSFWGDGPGAHKGQNQLGQCHMRLRTELTTSGSLTVPATLAAALGVQP